MSERRRLKAGVEFEVSRESGVMGGSVEMGGVHHWLARSFLDAISEPLPDPRRERIYYTLCNSPAFVHTAGAACYAVADAILAAIDEEEKP